MSKQLEIWLFLFENDVLFNKNKTIIIAYRSKNSNYTIPKSVRIIGFFAFCDNIFLRKIIIPDNVNSIGEGAFARCCHLESIILPKGIKGIKSPTFYDCESLTSIDIPNSVTTIEKSTFSFLYLEPYN